MAVVARLYHDIFQMNLYVTEVKVATVTSVGYMQLSPMFSVINFSLYFLKKEKGKIDVDEFAWLNSDLSCWLSSPLEETAFHT